MSAPSTTSGSMGAGLDLVPGVDCETATLAIENMRCGSCMRAVERALREVPGVHNARANLSSKRVTVAYDSARSGQEAMASALERAGFRAAPMSQVSDAQNSRDSDFLKRVAVAGFAAANVMLLSVSVWSGTGGDMSPATQALFHRLSALIAVPAVAYAGQPFFRSAAATLRAWRLNMDVPISLAVILATLMSIVQMFKGSEQVYFDAAVTLLFFLLVGRWLDQRLRSRAHGEAVNLLSLQSGFAALIQSDGRSSRVPAHALRPGDRILVAAGERIAADGLVLTGEGEVDQSLITGESRPAPVVPGSEVHAGTLNLGQPLTVEVTAADDMTLLAEISRLMANAEQGRAAYRRLADRAAAMYAPAVHLLGAATFAGWVLAGAGWEPALTHAIAVLIITCPCALALAVPAVQIAAASRLFRRGIILKTADALERLAEVDTVIFDKTGTLTLGRPVLMNAGAVPSQILRQAARLAAVSRHPYARAVVAAAEARFGPIEPAEEVKEHPGYGLERRRNGRVERLGSARWCGVERQQGESLLWYTPQTGEPVAFRFRDEVRRDAAQVVSRLQAEGFSVAALSGDGRRAVEEVATAAGISDWMAEVTPADKILTITKREDQHKVLMVGDGLNDAPALAAAHVSISPSAAADITQRTADLVFQGDRLAPVSEAIAIARKARFMAFQNFAIALSYNAICVPLAMAGQVTPLLAAVAMSTSSILVTANALRLATGGRGVTS